MMQKKLIFAYYKPQLLVPIIGLLWSVSSWGLSMIWGYGILQGTGPSAIVMLFLAVYEKWLWKFPILKFGNTMPNLNGKYSGKLSFHWNDTNKTKSCEIEIKQTCSNIKVKSVFKKDNENSTQSVSTEAFIKTDEAGDQHLYFYYHNIGSCKHGDTLNQHDGMNVLEIINEGNKIILKGYYFTNRNPQTKGCIEVTRIEGDK